MKNQTTRRDKDIAIVGMSARFPGAEDTATFWKNLLDGVETISTFTDEELRASGIEEEMIASPNYIRRRGILGNAQYFDASFFDITPRDAEIMDPQHRIFLECSWHAFEDAGYIPGTYPGKVGVFGGTGTAWHLNKVNAHPDVQKYASGASIVTNNDKDYVTTRVSYKLNLKGPSVNVQTACSTAMVAVVMGINSLLNGESDLIVAGGVSIDTPERRGYQYMQGGMESADGRCYTFDSRANGTVFSRGAGVVLLKRLSDAMRDGDHIYAVLKGGAINNDGNLKAGYTAPSIEGQIAVARQAFANAQVDPGTVNFVEAHGTATALGDPIEFTSLSQTFKEFTDKTQYCLLGSVKTNIGHTDAASGMASLIKASLALEHGVLPASLHYVSPNPNIDFETSPFVMNTELSKLEASDQPHRALVNSFGVGGTNACVVLEAAPQTLPSDRHDGLLMLPFSAKSRTALDAMKQRMHDYLTENKDVNLADVAYTLQVGRQKFAHSTVLVGSNREALLDKLSQPSATISSTSKSGKAVVFMFPGQGNQYTNMARELYATYHVFREMMDLCCRYLDPILNVNLQSIIFQGKEDVIKSRLNETQFTQPALFVVEYSLAQLWISWGIEPDAMIGHSVGEYVAACIAGVFSLEDALRAVALRGKLVQTLPAGAMLAVLMEEDSLRKRLQDSKLEIAAVNYPGLCVVAGTLDDIEMFQQQLDDNNIFCKHLDTSHGFHSYMMEPVLPAFKEVIDGIELHAPQIPFVSTVNGDWMTDELAMDSDYWVKHVRNPVLFSHAFSTLMSEEHQKFIFLEVGPGRSLESAAKQHFKEDEMARIYSSLPTAKDVDLTGEYLLTTLGNMWASGVEIPWANLYRGKHRCRLPLPGYPFERKEFMLPAVRHSNDSGHMQDAKSVAARKRKKADIGDWFYMPAWKRTIPAKFIMGECVNDATECWLLFADAMVVAEYIQKQLVEAGHNVLVVRQGTQYQEDRAKGCYVIDPARREDYVHLLNGVKNQGLRPTRIINLWNLSADNTAPSFIDDHRALQINAFYSPLYLQQALVSENLLENLHLLFVTNNIFNVTEERLYSPQKALIVGPARVFYHEYPEVQCHVVDVDLFGYAAPQDIAQKLIAESNINTHGNLVAYRGNHRWEENYQAVNLKQDGTGMPATVKDDGVYLITGGMGGLGLLVADYLSEISNATLILTYRSELPAREEWQAWIQQHPVDDPVSEKIAGILRLEARGNIVHLALVDVCDYTGMHNMLAEFTHIDGVFHTAGIAGGGIIPLKSDTDCASVLDPKVIGSLVLDELLKDKQPDFFILFSSITSIIGDEARIDYCSGNAFMDAFAHYRNQQRSGRTVSLNWGKWGDIGMAVRWTKQLIEKKKNSKTVVSDDVIGDLLTLIDCEGMQEIYQVNLAVQKDWVIDEHRLTHQPSLVGTTILSMLYEWLTHFKSKENLQVNNLLLTKPVIYHNGWPRTMNLYVRAENLGYKFSLRSKGVLDRDWQEHAQGMIGQKNTASDGAAVSIDEIRERCTIEWAYEPLDCEFGNANTGDVFLSLSPRWNNHKDILQGDNEWLIHKVMDHAYLNDFARYPYHPALIDSTAIRCLTYITRDNFLPISYGKITYHAPLNEDCYAHIKLKQVYQPQDNMITMDILFLSHDGMPLLALENYTLIKMTLDNQVIDKGVPSSTNTGVVPAVKVNLADKDILFYEGVDALKRQLAHLEFEQLVIATSDLGQLIYEYIPEQNEKVLADAEEKAIDGHVRPALSVAYVEPETDIEKEIVKSWQSVLGISGIGVNDNFIELGGNSLLAVLVVSAVSGLFEIDIRVDRFYQDPTVNGLSKLILAEFELLLQNE
ncbi:MAG: beta-ketoacyl synthase N-terminal-like domain-containing protein [Yersinia sp. (in: enterobacteria)]